MSGQGAREATSSIWLAVERVGLPDKKYFKIGEVAALVGVEPHVLRYWQTQFPQVRPQKSRSGHRLYRRRDVETLLLVRELLHVQRFTIAGARQALRTLVRSDRPSTGLPTFVDDEVEAAAETPARPIAAPPRPVATDVVAVEVEGLERAELEEALARQLAEAAGAELASVEVEVEGELDAAVQGASAPASLARSAVAPSAPAAYGAPAPSLGARGTQARSREEQLGFGFLPSNRAVLEAARTEVLAMLNLLDREDAAANRLRARPATAKS